MQTQKSPYALKKWLKNYDNYVKSELEFEEKSLADTLKESVKNYPNSLIYEFMGATSTYKEFEKKVISFANFLIERGMEKGDRIAINLPNCPQFMIALYGAFYAGCVVSGVNFLLKPNEIIYQLSDCGARTIVTMDSFYEETVYTALKSKKTMIENVITTNIADLMELNSFKKFLGKLLKKIPSGKIEPIVGLKFFNFTEIIERYPNQNAPNIKINPKKDLALLQYTGGTTGPPKGAMLTHFNEVSNIKQVYHWWEIDAQFGKDIFISGFPFFHLAGLFMNMGAITFGATQLLIPNPRDTEHMCELIKNWKPNIMVNVPTLYLMLIKDPKFKELDLDSIRVYVSGAAPFPSESIKEFEKIVGEHKLLEVYGMTEASPIVTMNPYVGERKIGTVGVPISNTSVRIVDVETNTDVLIGKAGEIAIKGPQVFQGYWNKPKETEHALRNGWFFSGDVGIMDEEGYLKIVDRTKDMINVSGYKVFSVEVDDKMNKHPKIELASSIGIPDPDRPGSEYVKLYVLLKEGVKATQETKEDIREYAKNNLARYKVPKEIEIVEEIPLTSVGKIDKKVLRSREP
ncbi:MAG: AMP-binding protein [Candidatus Lokiarchaeota archaeon]|nr:AMP-binding protein [Candidatus Lokiarchaeota archaeon]MBD3200463.1 AMP-binding protein [Candidatus Lokiarchaeota archaeon]